MKEASLLHLLGKVVFVEVQLAACWPVSQGYFLKNEKADMTKEQCLTGSRIENHTFLMDKDNQQESLQHLAIGIQLH